MCRSSKPKPSGKTEDKYVPDCSLYRLIPYFGPVADFLFDNLSISIYLCPLVYIGFIVLLPIDAPPVAVLFWLCRCPLRWIGRWGQRGSIRSLRFRSLCCAGRFCSLSAVRRGFGRVVFLLRSGWGRADFCATWQRWSWYTTSCFHVGVPVLGAVVPYARPTGRERCCYGGLHLAACAAVHH